MPSDVQKLLDAYDAKSRGKGSQVSKLVAAYDQKKSVQKSGISHEAAVFGTGINDGIASALGMPVDIINAGINTLGGNIHNPVGGSKFIRHLLPNPEPNQNTYDPYIRSAGQGVGAMLSGGPLGEIAGGGKALTGISGLLKSSAIGGVSGITSKAGQNAAHALAPKSAIAPYIGSLAGAFIPEAGIGMSRMGYGATIKPFTVSGSQETAGNMLNKVSRGDVNFAKPETKGVNFTTGQATQDPGLMALERSARNRTLASQAQTNDLNAANNSALKQGIESVQTSGSPEYAAQVVRNRFARITERARSELDAQSKNLDSAITRYSHGSKSQASENLNAQIKAAHKTARQAERNAWDAIDPNNEIAIPINALKKELSAYVKDQAKVDQADVPGDVMSAVRELSKPPPENAASKILINPEGTKTLGSIRSHNPITNIKELTRLRSKALEAKRMASAAGQKNTARMASDMADIIQNYMDNLPINDPSAIERYNKARKISAKANELYRKADSVNQVLAKNSQGADKLASSDTVKKFFQSDSSTAAKEHALQLKSIAGNKQSAMDAVKTYALKDLADKAVGTNGKVVASRLRGWVKNHKEALNQFPQVMDEVSNTRKLQDAIDNAQSRLDKTTEALKSNPASAYLNKEPHKAIQSVLSGANPVKNMRQLMRQVKGDPEAVAGVRRTLVDLISGKASTTKLGNHGEHMISEAGLDRFLSRHRPALQEAFTPDQMKILDAVRKDFSRTNKVTDAKIPGGSDTAQNIAGAQFIDKMLSRIPAGGGIIGHLIGKGINAVYGDANKKADSLLWDALSDPQLAKTLMQKATEKNIRSASKKYRPLLYSLIGASTTAQDRQNAGH